MEEKDQDREDKDSLYSFKCQVSWEKRLLGNSSDLGKPPPKNLIYPLTWLSQYSELLKVNSFLLCLGREELSLGVFKDIKSENRTGGGINDVSRLNFFPKS